MNVLCPAIAVTTSLLASLGIGFATLLVLVGSRTSFFFLKNIPPDLSLFMRVLIIAFWVVLVQMIFSILVAPLSNVLEIFLPLVAIGSLFAEESSCSLKQTFVKGLLLMGILLLIGSIRELLGNGSLFGLPLFENSLQIFLQPAGAFLVVGGLLVFQKFRGRHD